MSIATSVNPGRFNKDRMAKRVSLSSLFIICRLLFVTERGQRIDSGGAEGGHEACRESDTGQ